MRLALAQINPTVGDLDGNAALIARFTADARAERADLVVFPELALTGYPPRDLLLQEGFIAATAAAAQRLGREHSAGLTLVFGVPLPLNAPDAPPGAPVRRLANALLAWRDGGLLAYYDKRLLPTYDVFDENRYFFPGDRPVTVGVGGWRVGLSVCEDLWRGRDAGFADRYLDTPDPVDDLIDAGAQLIINPSASPFRLGVGASQRALLQGHARRRGVYVASVNQVGGNDELLFDGSACVYGPDGSLLGAGPCFAEALTVVELPRDAPRAIGSAVTDAPGAVGGAGAAPGQSGTTRGTPLSVRDPLTSLAPQEALFRALVMGVRDYCRKTGFTSAVLGLSGGIDSAVVAVLAAAALGPRAVHGVALPSKHSSPGSRTDAAALAAVLDLHFQTIPIGPCVAALESTLAPAFAGRAADVTEENLQSRLRGTILMALSNKFGHILLTTGNKSETAVGYATLYGDMNGGLAVISDVTKTLVYRLARWMNAHWQRLGIAGLSGPPIPEPSITKAPSAELRPDQTDQDSLPPYDVLDEIVDRYVGERQSPARILAGMSAQSSPVKADAATVKRVVRLIDLAEYKRKQAALGLKVTSVAFGTGRRIPIAQAYRPERGLE
ncbi:MAG: NAD+ synthase [Phycisphaerales bacterium]|nr:NAD+ synthase [Phycisphaerales bacterium]